MWLSSACAASESATRPSGPTSVTSPALAGAATSRAAAVSPATLRTRVVHAHGALDGYDVLRSRERRGRGLPRRARPADRLEEFLEAMGRDEPHHHEVLGAVVHDLVLDVVAEEAGGAGDERVLRAVDQHVTAAAEADLQFDLGAVRGLAHAAARRDRLIAHRQRRKPRELGREPLVGGGAGGRPV